MAKANKIPKTIAGIKVPRALRKSKTVRKFLKDPDNRRMITSALMAAGGAVATAVAEHRPGGKQIKQAGHEASHLGVVAAQGVHSAVDALGEAVSGVAHTLASSLASDAKRKRTTDMRDPGDIEPHNRH